MSRKAICLLSVLITVLISLPLHDLEVRFHPGERVYLFEDEPQRQLYSAVLQNVAFVQKGPETVTLQSVRIEVRDEGRVVQSLLLDADQLVPSAQRMHALQAQGALELYDFHLQTSRYLDKDVRFPSSLTLAPGDAVVMGGKALLVHGLPDEISVAVLGRTEEDKLIEARGSVKLVRHESPNEYVFPMAGTVWVAAAPDFHSHHRWAANQEFALDLVTFGAEGGLFRGDGLEPKDYYGFGQEVLAIGDGVVVEVEDGQPETPIVKQGADETEEEFMRKSMARQQALLSKGLRTVLGNFVVIRHPGEEYSNYVHLQAGSVRVKAGDKVARGQVIGRIGQSGNSDAPHLHFQVTDGADPMYSRGLPVRFGNVMNEFLSVEGRHLHTGWIVTAR